MEGIHIPVLLNELVSSIKIDKNKQNIIVDCTLGLGGHAKEIINKMHKNDIFIGFDADIRNLKLATKNLENINNDVKKIFINSNYVNLKEELNKIKINNITGIYYDLGISSLHVDEADRGFSFKYDGPLDMRFDTNSGLPASNIVNTYNEIELTKIFSEYGEEPASKKIAKKIIEKRKSGFKFTKTKDLADLIDEITKFPKTKARIFQSLRIETNKEIENLKISLKDAINLLETGGSIFIISFHSLEDRVVKNIFREETKDCLCKDLICTCKHKKNLEIQTKKPIIPTLEEEKINKRSRSAKARYAIKI
ncbi:MAG: 16S rRNA (cytosine(1402)-N(4))-methyltransferase RsmH [Candidatus Gracilibacteria bacterium]|nr:16S rRNA (cytosine(1402)-N(4))-methyltransferase RsmH [Candidatus Gracilibacteria bacterium]